MRTFTVERKKDESGISGTGVVIEGVIFDNGQTVVHWLTPKPDGSIAVWPSMQDFMNIHILSHPTNETVIEYSNGERWEGDTPVMPPGAMRPSPSLTRLGPIPAMTEYRHRHYKKEAA